MMWRNPIKKGGFADPFVLRYNGSYYLYCTGQYINCWRSENLVDWDLYGPVISEDEFPGLRPFAPEVVYHNGSFYMYTSPSGYGHYVLKSDSPLGPFRKITDNIGHAIDFSVFVDDDGAWYAYWADDKGILGCKMSSPSEFGMPQYIGASLHGWTEGPFVVKVEGKYHLTYTGNHFLSKGYRIQGACADSPLGPYRDYPHNPIAIRTQGDVVGLGHSSTVLGPDLQEFYIFYHNLNPDRTRDLNMDRMFFHEMEGYVVGPTTTPQAEPKLPDFMDLRDSTSDKKWHIEKGGWRIENDVRITDGAFSARCADKLPQTGAAELHFAAASIETEQYGVRFCTGEKELLLFVEKTSRYIILSEPLASPIWKADLPHDYCHSALHRLTIRFDGSSPCTTAFLDALRLPQIPLSLGGSEFGYFSSEKMLVGSTAFSEKHDRVLWPIPSTAVYQGGLHVSVPESGRYIAAFTGRATPEPDLMADGAPTDVCVLHKTPGTLSVAVDLSAGVHRLGSASKAACQVTLFRAPVMQTESLKAQLGKWDKQCGAAEYVDFELTSHMTVKGQDKGWEAGIIFRASNLADGGEGNDKVLGTNFFIGYRLSISDGYLRLWRHRYDQLLLKEVPVIVPQDIHLSVQAVGNLLTCSLGETAMLRFTDDSPIITGHVGFHTRGCSINESELICKSKAPGGTGTTCALPAVSEERIRMRNG